MALNLPGSGQSTRCKVTRSRMPDSRLPSFGRFRFMTIKSPYCTTTGTLNSSPVDEGAETGSLATFDATHLSQCSISSRCRLPTWFRACVDPLEFTAFDPCQEGRGHVWDSFWDKTPYQERQNRLPLCNNNCYISSAYRIKPDGKRGSFCTPKAEAEDRVVRWGSGGSGFVA